MAHPFSQRLSDVLLGREKDQRMRAGRVLLVFLLDAVLFGIGAFGVLMGIIDPVLMLGWVLLTLVVIFGFYVAIRTGFNKRFVSDPALTMPQSIVGVCVVVGCYVICTPVRGAILLSLACNLMFGMFALRPSQSRRLSLFAVLLLGATMGVCHHVWPDRYPAAQEVMHFMLVGVLLPSIAYLAGQLSGLRHKLSQRGHDLERALEQNRQLACRDELTGLHNRRHMHDLMTADFKRAQRTGIPTTLVLIDIDHFKRVNDGFGHACGDEVLRAFATHARAELRETDSIGRWGGEEFVVMLPETSAEAAVHVIARIHRRLAGVSFDAIDPGMKVTFSAGIASGRPDEDWAATVERADHGMYAAKQAGRDRSLVV